MNLGPWIAPLAALLSLASSVAAQTDFQRSIEKSERMFERLRESAGDVRAAFEASQAAARQQERIVDFHGRIEVRADGSIAVSETIAVVAAGERIKRGIYRDFPTVYDGRYGTKVVVPFRLLGVERDGRPEPHHTGSVENGVRIYAGAEDVLVPPGPHTYEIIYETGEQLGFFADHDELYWNVTGNGWAFPIEHASANVYLPGVPSDRVRLEGYTGRAGSQDRALVARVEEDGSLRFETTKALAEYEGLTIVASFPKGFVAPPTSAQRRAAFLRGNRMLLVAAAGFTAVLFYYVIAWVLVGRDPRRGTVIPLFEPPLGLTPACLRYVRGMGYDQRCFSAALLSLAVKGWLSIEERDGQYSLARSAAKDGAPLSRGERRVLSELVGQGSITLESKNHRKVKAAIRGLREALHFEHDGRLFQANRNWLFGGLGLSAAALLATGLSGRGEQIAVFLFMMVWLGGWTWGCFALLSAAATAWRTLLSPVQTGFARAGALVSAVLVTAFTLPFLGGEVAGLVLLVTSTSLWMAPFLVGLVGLGFLFLQLLKQPTHAGRRVMDAIDGFKMYLETAEGEEIAGLGAPAKTPQLYERYLPYAVALEVENEWAEKFAGVLAAAGQGDDGAYRPLWYRGDAWQRLGAGRFTGSLGSSLSGAISSSSTAPSSRSGGGGGGSSGGGGGGGGGGGW